MNKSQYLLEKTKLINYYIFSREMKKLNFANVEKKLQINKYTTAFTFNHGNIWVDKYEQILNGTINKQ